jgi:hypothetical protein
MAQQGMVTHKFFVLMMLGRHGDAVFLPALT